MTLTFAFGAVAAAVKVTCCGVPTVSVMLVGETVTPAGTPVICTLIDDEKPLTPVADKLTDPELPAFTDKLIGLSPRLKSGVGGGGELCEPPPPPQAVMPTKIVSTSDVQLTIRRYEAFRRVRVIGPEI